MCFTIPKKIISIENGRAKIEGGASIDIEHLECEVGDYIIVSADIAIQKIEREEAESMRTLIKQTHDKLS